MRSFFVALQFLTILPVDITPKVSQETFGRSLAWFPIVGAIIGLALSLNVFLFGILPQMVIAALIMALSVIITGGIHLDGFADTCDGLYGSTAKERALEIMRDSHIGSMAALGIAMLLVLKFSLLASMPQQILWKLLVLMAAFARWSQALSCFLSEYARDDGKARYFIEYATWRELLIGGAFTLALFLLSMKSQGAIIFFTSLLVISLPIYYIKARIGGMTGDTIGAINEVSEVTVLLFGLTFWKIGL